LTPDLLRKSCLAHTGASEGFPFGPETSVFKVGGKIFAIAPLGADPLRVSLKCEPELSEGLRATHAAITPGYHLNKRHWITVTLDDSLPDSMVGDLIEDSYDLVLDGLPARERAALRGDTEAAP
jgi:predicted DNA-binding protein (MmcQ/YjbR family)